VLAFFAFPAEHWPKPGWANPLERFNREIGRRTDVVGILPDDASPVRLVSMLAIEANDCHEGRPGRGAAGAGATPRRQTRRLQTTDPTREAHVQYLGIDWAPARPRGARSTSRGR
jgi:mutator family transposase